MIQFKWRCKKSKLYTFEETLPAGNQCLQIYTAIILVCFHSYKANTHPTLKVSCFQLKMNSKILHHINCHIGEN